MNIGHDPDVFHNMSADALDDALDSLPSQRMDDDQQRALRTAVKQVTFYFSMCSCVSYSRIIRPQV